MVKKNPHRGFTLIELLVVIAIIGLLSSVILASLNSARKKARGNAFAQSLQQAHLALELYKDKYGEYPDENDIAVDISDNNGSDSLDVYMRSGISTGNYLIPQFMPTFPHSIGWPANPSASLFYITDAGSIDAPLKCGEKPFKGYALVYSDQEYTELPLPQSVFDGNVLYPGNYCFTGN